MLLVRTSEIAHTDLEADYGYPAEAGEAEEADRAQEPSAGKRITHNMRQGDSGTRLHDDGRQGEDL